MGEPEKLERRTSRPPASLRTKSGAASPCLSIAPQRAAREIKLAYRLAPTARTARHEYLWRAPGGGPPWLAEEDLELLLDDAVDGVHEVDLEDRAGRPQPPGAHPGEEPAPGGGQPL